VSESLKRRLFWVVSHTCFTLYRWFPLFGSLRASLAIIHRDGKILAIQRNDGRGISLPGGIAHWREPLESTLRREVEEETGMRVISEEFRLKFHATADIPCHTSVFLTQAEGELKNSWEGSPRWMTVAELEPRFVQSQQPALELIRKICGSTSEG